MRKKDEIMRKGNVLDRVLLLKKWGVRTHELTIFESVALFVMILSIGIAVGYVAYSAVWESQCNAIMHRLLNIPPNDNFHDPTYAEIKNFVAYDNTDEHSYASNYVCLNFAADVIRNAGNKNIHCGLVALTFTDGKGHALVVFDTTDKGLIFIEPQNDEEVQVAVGAPYEKSVYGLPLLVENIIKINIYWM